jgi:hypothetical protein
MKRAVAERHVAERYLTVMSAHLILLQNQAFRPVILKLGPGASDFGGHVCRVPVITLNQADHQDISLAIVWQPTRNGNRITQEACAMTSSMKTAAVVAAVLCLLAVFPAPAQTNGCQSFRVLLQANLDLTAAGIPWSGTVRGFLNGTEPLIGKLSYLPGSESTQTGQAGHETNDRAKFDFGVMGIFVTEPHTAVFPLRPTVLDPFAFGSYHATAKVAPDPLVSTGRFVTVTGNISIIGTFLVDMFSLPSAGIWNAEITGKLCSVQ